MRNAKVLGTGNYKGRNYKVVKEGKTKKLVLFGLGIVGRLVIPLGGSSAREVAKSIVDRLS